VAGFQALSDTVVAVVPPATSKVLRLHEAGKRLLVQQLVPQRAQGIRCFMWSPPTEESAAALGLAAEAQVRVERPSTHSNVGRPRRRKSRTSNLLERVHREVKRRTRVAELFPNDATVLRLVTALLVEIDQD
jgi:hypothetical protein